MYGFDFADTKAGLLNQAIYREIIIPFAKLNPKTLTLQTAHLCHFSTSSYCNEWGNFQWNLMWINFCRKTLISSALYKVKYTSLHKNTSQAFVPGHIMYLKYLPLNKTLDICALLFLKCQKHLGWLLSMQHC